MRVVAVLVALVSAAVSATPAHAATHGKVAVVYTRASNAYGQDVVTYACAGAGTSTAVPQSYSCTVSPYAAVLVTPDSHRGSVITGPAYTITVRMSVRSVDGLTWYTCERSVALTVGAGDPVGELDCTA